jgi:hypothetical protein
VDRKEKENIICNRNSKLLEEKGKHTEDDQRIFPFWKEDFHKTFYFF